MSATEHVRLGQAAQQAGQVAEAINHFKAALDADLENFEAAQALGLLLLKQRDFAQAEIYLTHALQLNGAVPQLYYALGVSQMAQWRPGDALLSYERALAIDPGFMEAHNNRGVILQETTLKQEALACFDRAIALKPGLDTARANKKKLLNAMERKEKLSTYPAIGFFNLGFALQETKRSMAALNAYETALSLDSNLPYLRGALFDARQQICDWRDYESRRDDLLSRIEKDEAVAWPFQILAATSDPALQLRCARRFVSDTCPAAPSLPGQRYDHERLRVAYMSADFRNHPVSQLLADIIEKHDRTRFEVFGISLGADDGSALRKRLASAFDRFLDGQQMSDADIAAGIRDLEIDILVDLNGHTAGARTGILVHRPAPIQVNFLGFAATMGADFIDYIVADKVAVPDGKYFAEKIAALPICFQPNSMRRMADRIPSRAKCGLPESGFVFCAFNSSFKITPDIFTVWMQLLNDVPGSVLWLRDGNAEMRGNLMREAEARGVAGNRLVFALPMERAEDHLARHRHADLFLDTLHFNAHTTASDALWCGLPVVTCPGESYASRVSASLLTALGLKELIANSLTDYEAIALRLARDPGTLSGIKKKLLREKDTNPVFDSARFTRDLEDLYAGFVGA